MKFPKFIQTGPAAEFAVTPFQKQPMNLGPIISSLRQQQAASKKAPKKPVEEMDMSGTIGQVQQSQSAYDQTMAKYNSLMNFYGAEAFVQMPEYRGLVQELEYHKRPELENTRKINKERLDSFDEIVKSKGASADVHLGMLAKTGIGMTNGDWSHYMQYAQTDELPGKEKGSSNWEETFEYAPAIYRMEDAQEGVNKILENHGYTERGYKTGREEIKEKALGNIFGALSTYNSSFYDSRNNGMEVGEARKQALARAFSGMDLTDRIPAGYWQSFVQGTTGMSSLPSAVGAKGTRRYKEVLINRHSGARTAEQEKELDKNHIGYYFKGGDRDGQMDLALMQQDYSAFVGADIDFNAKKRIEDSYKSGDDNKLTFNQARDEAYKGRGKKKDVDLWLQSAKQFNVSSAKTELQGFTGDYISNMVKSSGVTPGQIEDYLGLSGTIGKVVSDASYAGDRTVTDNLLKNQGSISPLLAKEDSNGVVRYTANPSFNKEGEFTQAIKIDLAQKHPDWTEDELDHASMRELAKVTEVYNEVQKTQVSLGKYGDGRQDAVVTHWDTFGASEVMKGINKTLFPQGRQTADGTQDFFTGIEALSNVDVIVGEGSYEGAHFIGNGKIIETGNGVTMRANSYPINAGAQVQNAFVMGGVQYEQGDFFPAHMIDGVDAKEAENISKQLKWGSGYWQFDKDGKASQDNAKPDRTGRNGALKTMGKNGEVLYTRIATNGPNAIADAPAQMYTQLTIETAGTAAQQLKEWEDKGITIKAERLDYTDTETGNQYFQKAFTTLNPNGLGRSTLVNVEEAANNLGLTGRNRENFMAEARNNFNPGSKNSEIPVGYLSAAGGKYLALQDRVQAKNWNTTPTLKDVPLVVNGKIAPEGKTQLGWTEKGGRGTYFVPGNITQSFDNGESSEYLSAGYNMHSKEVLKDNNSFKTQGTQGEAPRGPSGTNSVGIPGVNPIQTR